MALSRRRFWLGASLLAAGATSGAFSAAQPVQKQTPPVFGADVTLVAVPVFVTDRSGKAVPGLTAEDFQVYDGGRRVPIAAFQAVDVDLPVAAAADLPVAIQAAAPRQFLLLFDLQFSPPTGITRARAAAIRFVKESLATSDLVAVATFGRGGLKMLTNFTTDHAYVARAIEGLGLVQSLALASDPLGLSGEFELPATESTNARAAMAEQELAAQVAAMNVELKRAYTHRVLDFLATLEELARALAPLRGRKQILLLSGGVDESGWVGPRSEGERTQDPQWMVVQDKMRRVFRSAGRSDVVIHTISLAGLEGPVDVTTRTGRNQGLGAGRLSLAALAENTGGHFARPTNDFDRALGDAEEVSRHYYVLAFQPAEPEKPGRPRSLKVRVRGDRLSVSHRAAYLVPARSSVSDPAAARLAASEAVAKGLPVGSLSLQLVAMPYSDREGGAAVPAVLHIDGPALLAAAQGERLEVQVYGYAVAAGRILDSLALETTLDLGKLGSSIRSDGLRVLTTFAAAPGAVDLRFFVRAVASGEIGAIGRQLQLPAFLDSETAVSAPLLTVSPAGRIALPLQSRRAPPLEIPFRLGSEPFVPGEASLEPYRPRELCVFVRRAGAKSKEPLEVTAEIARSGEPPLPLRIEGGPRVVRDDDGYDRYLVTVVPPQAPPGEYTLRLTFQESGTSLTLRSETGVVIRKS